MDKGSARLFGATAVITATIIGGVYLLDRANKTGRPLPPEQATWTTLQPGADPTYRHPGLDPGPNTTPEMDAGSGAGMTHESSQLEARDPGSTIQHDGHVPAGTSSVEGIIVCQHPQHGTVYTNAASCEEADLDNRISHADTFNPIPGTDRYKASDYQTPQNAAGNSRTDRKAKNNKPNLRLIGKSPPSGLNVSCKFSVGKALELERPLAAADDPRESTWRDSYCKQRCEAIVENCPVADEYFYYRYHYVFGNSDYGDCYYQARNKR